MTAKRMLLALVVLSLPASDSNATVTVAVVDTGIDASTPNLCHMGHKSFVKTGPLVDENGHGTQMATVVNNTVKSKHGYCIVSIKWFDEKSTGPEKVANMAKAIQYAANINASIINISGGGGEPEESERIAVLNAINKRIPVVAAAGNEDSDLSKSCNYFPACYDVRVITVGNLQPRTRTRQPSSNYGNYIKRWEIGTNLFLKLPDGQQVLGTGTSHAAAVATGKLVKAKLNK